MPKRQTAGARTEEALREPVRSDRSRGLRALGVLSLQLFPRRLKDGERRRIEQNKVDLFERGLSVPTAGNAIVRKPFSAAMRKECAVELRRAAAVAAPPNGMLAA